MMAMLISSTVFLIGCLGLFAIRNNSGASSYKPFLPQEVEKWRLRLLLLLLIMAWMSLAITIHSDNGFNTTAGYLFRLFKPPSGADSWEPMSRAIEHIRQNPDVPVYDQIFFKEHIKFQYPISSLLFIDLIQRMSNASWTIVYKFLNLVSLFFLPMIGLVSYFLLKGSLEKEHGHDSIPYDFGLLMLCVLIVLFFYPLTRSYGLGQIQTAITLLVALALLSWQRNRYQVSGLLLGICCAIKPQWMVMVLWGGMRRQWGFAIACAGTFALCSLVAILLYGVQNMADYISVLSYISHHGESYFGNQSINGLANRFLFNGNNLYWDEKSFPPYQPLVYWFTMMTGMSIIFSVVFWRIRKEPSTLDLALVTLGLTIASPVAWKHHYAILLPIFAVAGPTVLSRKPWGKHSYLYMTIAFLLAGQQLDEIVNWSSSSHLNILQSYLFIGALMTLFLLFQLTGENISKKLTHFTPSSISPPDSSETPAYTPHPFPPL